MSADASAKMEPEDKAFGPSSTTSKETVNAVLKYANCANVGQQDANDTQTAPHLWTASDDLIAREDTGKDMDVAIVKEEIGDISDTIRSESDYQQTSHLEINAQNGPYFTRDQMDIVEHRAPHSLFVVRDRADNLKPRTTNGPFVMGDQIDVLDHRATNCRLLVRDQTGMIAHSAPNGPFVAGDQADIAARTGSSLLDPLNGFRMSSNQRVSLDEHEHSSFVDQYDRLKWSSLSPGISSLHQQRRTDFSLADKVRLIEVAESTGKSQRCLAAEFHISVGSVNKILKRKHEYRAAHENGAAQNGGSTTISGHQQPERSAANNSAQTQELQLVLMRWLDLAKATIRPLTWSLVLEKAREFATRLNVKTFSTSEAWLDNLRYSLNLPQSPVSVTGSADRDARIKCSWRKTLPYLLQGYQSENVFCVTETILHYSCLPDCCYIGGHTCQVLERRFTVLLCCSALGERMKPLIISHQACPPSLQGISSTDLPVIWCHQSNGVITADIFTSWLLSVEATMTEQRRHIALFMDMTPSHLSSTLLRHVSPKFFLEDSSHLVHPLNQGIIRDFKVGFRRRLLQAALVHGQTASGDSAPKLVLSELDAVFWILEAWRRVSVDTIHACFQNTDFLPSFRSGPVSSGTIGISPLPSDYISLIKAAGRMFNFVPMSPEFYAEFDSHVLHHFAETEEWEASLLAEVTGDHIEKRMKREDSYKTKNATSSGTGLSPGEAGDLVVPSVVMDCLVKLKRFSSSNIGLLASVFDLEKQLLDSLVDSLAGN